MSNRSLLRQHITSAWRETVESVYPKRLINSERGLQVHFCHKLFAQFGDLKRQVFVEPCFVSPSGAVRSPDIVVCHSKSIIGVIELKYMPRVSAEFSKDLQTLEWFHSGADSMTLSNDRYLGEEITSPTFELAPDALLCWAGIYRGPKIDIELHGEALGRRFLSLHAVTAPGKHPELFPPVN